MSASLSGRTQRKSSARASTLGVGVSQDMGHSRLHSPFSLGVGSLYLPFIYVEYADSLYNDICRHPTISV